MRSVPVRAWGTARRPQTESIVSAGLLAAAVLALAALIFGALAPGWPPAARCGTDACKEGREWLAFAATGAVLVAGLYQYWRAQQWKRAEFLAQEMEAFLSKPLVRRAMLMIDWGTRNVNLLESQNADLRTWPLVSRPMQSRALLPHPLVNAERKSDQAAGDLSGFSLEEAAVRDCYDAFLDGLERFASYISTGLISVADLRPYLKYWIDDIAAKTDDPLDAEWTCSFLAYVDYYQFDGVQALFRRFGHKIEPSESLFRGFLGRLSDDRARALRRVLGLTSPEGSANR